MISVPESICRFGIARADITPPVGIYHRMWGAARHDKSVGIHRPLLATAIAFADADASNGDVQVLLALDHCVLGEREIERVLAPLASQGPVSPAQVATICSHTHAAGLMLLDRESSPGGDGIAPYLDSLGETVVKIVSQALADLQMVTMSFTSGRCNLAAHRDSWDEASQQWVCGFHGEGDSDDTVLVGRVVNEQDKVVASIVNYGCHPTTLAWDNQLVSPDFPGAMREVIEQQTEAPCVFIQGASGDLGPVRGFVGETEQADQNGRQLGYAALSSWESLPPAGKEYHYTGPVVSGATIGTWHHQPVAMERESVLKHWSHSQIRLDVPYRKDIPTKEEVEAQRRQLLSEEEQAREAGDEELAAVLRARVERMTRAQSRFALLPPDSYPYDLVAWRFGEVIWLIVPGEPYQSFQVELRRRFPQQAIVVATIAGHWGPSYLPPKELYGTGVYQESIAVLEPGSLERVIDAAAELIKGLL